MYIQSTCDPSCWGKNECDRNGELLIFYITEPLLKFIPQNLISQYYYKLCHHCSHDTLIADVSLLN